MISGARVQIPPSPPETGPDSGPVLFYHVYLESYRSGHNGAVLKTVRRQRHRGSNPLLSAMINAEFVYQTDPAFFMFMEAKYLASL